MTSSLRRLGEYEIVRELGRGSMGVVFLVRKRGVERELALKVISDSRFSNPTSRERFRREARLLARINHPGVLRVHDAGEEQGLLYYVMDVVRGVSVEERIEKRGPIPVPEACAIVRSVALALDAIHHVGIIHRDMKPANVLLEERTGNPLIADFGLARDVESDEARLTKTGHSVGTPSYMSPEQVRARKDVDARADVYALGAILYYALTGQDPFPAATIEDLVRQILMVEPARPSSVVPTIPPAVDRVCLRALAKKREDRPLTASDFAAELALAAAAPVPVPARGRRSRLLLCGVAGVVAAALLAAPPLLAALQELEGSREALDRGEAAALAKKLQGENRARQDALLAAAQERFVEHDDDQTISKAREALRWDRDDARTLALLGRALASPFFVSGAADPRVAEGRAMIARAQEKAPSSPEVLLARSQLALIDGQRSDVAPLLREVLARGNVLERLEAVSLWLSAIGREDLDRLLSVVDGCLVERQTSPEGHFLRGLVLQDLKRKAEAKQELDRCLRLDPKRHDARRLRASLEDDLGLLDAAREDYLILRDAFTEHSSITFLLGVNAEKRGDTKEALRLYGEALDTWPKGTLEPIHTRRGLLYFTLDQWELAASDLEIGLAGMPVSGHWRKLATAYEKLGLIGKARDAWEAAIKLAAWDADLIVEYGALREHEDAPASCIAFYKEAEKEVRAENRSKIEDRITAQERREAAEKALTDEERSLVLKIRNDRTQRRIDEIKAAQDAAESLPLAQKKRKYEVLARELKELDRYIEETRRFLKK